MSSQKIELISKAIKNLDGQMENCKLCPRDCDINRTGGKLGFCSSTDKVKLYKYKIHHGEEPPISGKNGSGIIFFSGCTMACVFCQNYPMSLLREGYEISENDLAKIMISLENQGVHNINLVTPGHFLPNILKSLKTACQSGLSLPIVYNTSGYEKIDILTYLNGIIDIYLTDMKYSDHLSAKKYSKASDYPEVSYKAVKEMYRQVGQLKKDQYGIGKSGLIIRHLVLPNELSGTEKIFLYIAQELDKNIHISLMSQYLPVWNAKKHAEISRTINSREFSEASGLLEKYGLENGWIQDFEI